MNLEFALSLLQANGTKQSATIYKRMKDNNLNCFGVHIGKIEKLAKSIPKNNILAIDLWNSDYLEARMFACLLFEPNMFSEDELTQIASRNNVWIISHFLCKRFLSKVQSVENLAYKWIDSSNTNLRRCGYLTLGYCARNKKHNDDFFYLAIENILKSIVKEENFVKDAMITALYNFGKRSSELGLIVIEIMNEIGEIKVDYGENSCTPINVKYHIERTLKSY